ncbi:unnamed protein product [Phytophthora fragariaefolia]|uniref:Unnamed protein product n=1 Tax=Phytophthora fragariaefolia TaxID=1490495 RepID=A0A9W6XM14_9STRA|nr:unnamed protein product [Phytophthora fragariaefolia]
MCIFEAASGLLPFSGNEPNSVDGNRVPKQPENLSDAAYELVLAMTNADPDKRPSLSQVAAKLKEFAGAEKSSGGCSSQVTNVPVKQRLIRCVECSKIVPSSEAYSSACLKCFVQTRKTSASDPKFRSRRKTSRRLHTVAAKKLDPIGEHTTQMTSPITRLARQESSAALVLRQRPKAPGDQSYFADDWARCKPRGGTGYYALELAKFKKHMLPAIFALQCRACSMNVISGLFQGVQRPRNCRVCGELFCRECLKSIPLTTPFESKESQSCCVECQNGLRDGTIATVKDVFAQRNDRIARFLPAIESRRFPLNKVVLQVLVSSGRYLEIYKGRYNGRAVAISMLPRTHYAGLGADAFLNNVVQAAKLDHPSIVRFVGVAWNSLDDLCAVSEFVSGGNLRLLLSRFKESHRRKGFDLEKVRIAFQVAQALAFMHSLHITHDDIRPDSVLLTERGNAKLTGFHRCPTPKYRKNVDQWLAES